MKQKKRVLIIGGQSQIAKGLTGFLHADHYQLVATTRDKNKLLHDGDLIYLDLADITSFQALAGQHFDACLLCAGITDTQYCERYPEPAHNINVSNSIELVRFLFHQKVALKFILLSTNQVFSGETPFPDVDDVTQPINQYGAFKSELERYVLALDWDVVILRLTKVIGSEYPLFTNMLQALSQGESISVFEDMMMAPVPLKMVLEGLKALIDSDKQAQQIYQLSGDKNYSYYQVVCFLAAELGLTLENIQPCSKADSGVIAPTFASMLLNMGGRGHYQAPSMQDCFESILLNLKERLG